jgi:polyphosphate kinase 2 (PPK2 family)
MLETIDLSPSLSKHAYKHIMHYQVERLYELEHMAYTTKVPVIILFEGWDAAGKGTAISRLTERLDPRGYKVLPTQAPRTHEMQKPWLWRFWMQIPRRGQMAIFDRSWYGRVLVERVKGLTPIPDWIRAYEEINGFERTLADDGIVMVKFWLHISQEEQLRRFVALTQDPDTAWQVTAEDWDNHHEYAEYEAAVEDMLTNTSTEYAPWTVVPANDMYYKTYLVFKTIIDQLEIALGVERTEWKDLAILEDEAAKKRRAKKKKKANKAKAKVAGQDSAGDTEEKPGADSAVEATEMTEMTKMTKMTMEDAPTDETSTQGVDAIKAEESGAEEAKEEKIEEATHHA